MIEIFEDHKNAADGINMQQRWKGKMTKIDKLRKWVKMLIKNNNEMIDSFDFMELVDEELGKNAVELCSEMDNDDDKIDVNFENLCSGKNSLNSVLFLHLRSFQKGSHINFLI